MHNTRTTIRAVALVTGLCLGAIAPAFAAGFDCALARSPVERAICADPVLNEQDEQLNARWREIQTLTQYPDALKSDQIAWIGKRNHCATEIPCLRRNYARRLAELTPDAVSGAFDWAGTWVRIDGPAESGTLSLQKESENRYRVAVSAASGGNMGELDGFARSNQAMLLLLPQDDCRIVFRQVHRQLEVEQQSGLCGAGMGVDYSGRYVPVRTATDAAPDRIDSSQVKPQWNLLNLGIVEHPDTDTELRRLLGPADYQALVDRAQFVTTEVDQDGFDAKASSFRMRGLGSDMSALLIQAKDGRLWVALLDSGQVRYYSNAPDWTQHLPTTVRTWIDSGSGVTQTKFMSARGKTSSYP